MAAKLLSVLFLATVVSQGYAVTEVRLPDQTTTYVTNPLIHKTIGIPKFWFDTLVSCNVIYPNGAMFSAYPTNNLLHDQIEYLSAVPPFNSCAIGFRNPTTSFSGTYELLSHVRHEDNTQSLMRQKFHLTFVEANIWSKTENKEA